MSERRFRIPRLYKTLLALAVVIGPMYWLLFTSDGQRRTDMALMWVLGRPPFDAALDAFDERLDEARLRASFPLLDLDCAAIRGHFAERACSAPIGSFNGYPARSVTLYFRGDHAVAVRVVYRAAYHDSIRGWVERRTGHAGDAAREAGSGASGPGVPGPAIGDGAAIRKVAGGVLAMKDGALGKGDEPALLWLSNSALAELKAEKAR